MTGAMAPPLMSIALEPRTSENQTRLGRGLARIMSEDHSLTVQTDPETDVVTVFGMGEEHLEIVLDRLKREFGVEATVGRPQIAYKETVTQPADGETKYVGRAGRRARYAHVKLHVVPGNNGSGYVFENESIGGAIPDAYIDAIDDGIRDSLARGTLAGHPVTDLRVVLDDGSYHDVDSSEEAFRIAGRLAFYDAARKANPVLLEPVMRVEVSVPGEYINKVLAGLASRGARHQLLYERMESQVAWVLVPLSRMRSYAAELRACTGGRGTCVMHFDGYRPVASAEEDGGDRDSLVTSPLKPRPPRNQSSIALPEPTEHERHE